MATKDKKKTTVKVDFTGVEVKTLVPEGDYKIKAEEITQEKGEDSGKPYLAWKFGILEGKLKGQKLFYNTSLQANSLWNLRGVLEAFGVEVDGAMELDLKELVSECSEAGCTVEHETYDGKKRAHIVDIFSADNIAEGEDATETAFDPETIDDMDENDLEELIKEHKLDLDLDDHKKLKAKREAVKEAMTAKPDKKASKKASKKEDAAEKPTESDLDDMDEEELQEVIDQFNLEVDLDDHKKIAKKREAILEALGTDSSDGENKSDEEKVDEDAIGEMGKDELAAFAKKHKLKVELEGNTSKQRRVVLKAAKKAGIIEE